jgi:hypothetical protein
MFSAIERLMAELLPSFADGVSSGTALATSPLFTDRMVHLGGDEVSAPVSQMQGGMSDQCRQTNG